MRGFGISIGLFLICSASFASVCSDQFKTSDITKELDELSQLFLYEPNSAEIDLKLAQLRELEEKAAVLTADANEDLQAIGRRGLWAINEWRYALIKVEKARIFFDILSKSFLKRKDGKLWIHFAQDSYPAFLLGRKDPHGDIWQYQSSSELLRKDLWSENEEVQRKAVFYLGLIYLQLKQGQQILTGNLKTVTSLLKALNEKTRLQGIEEASIVGDENSFSQDRYQIAEWMHKQIFWRDLNAVEEILKTPKPYLLGTPLDPPNFSPTQYAFIHQLFEQARAMQKRYEDEAAPYRSLSK